MFEMVRMDESAADIRDMNRRLQRMLEETLSKNLVLQKVIWILIHYRDILLEKFKVQYFPKELGWIGKPLFYYSFL